MSRILIGSLMLSLAAFVGCESSSTTTTTNPGTHTVKKVEVKRPDGTVVTREREVREPTRTETEINTPSTTTTITKEKEVDRPASGDTEIDLPNRKIKIEKKDPDAP